MPMLDPPHPGEIVREECLTPLGLTVTEGAKVLGVTRQALNNLVNERAGISPHDSAARFRELGVDVFLGQAAFTGRDTITVGGQTLRFARAVIATGSRAHHPPIPGLAEAGVLTNENVFALTELPRRLAVIGAGPVGC